MPELFQVGAGRWPCFDRYEVRDGYIRPAPDATLRFDDPWTDYRRTANVPGTGRPPYGALVDLVNTFQLEPAAGPGPLRVPTAATAERLAAWCGQHGLLGVLLQRVQMVTLAPRYDCPSPAERGIAICQDQYTRTSRGWTQSRRSGRRARHARAGTSVPAQEVPRNWPTAHAVVQDLCTGAWQVERLSTTWGRFVINDTDPAPLSDAFWRAYQEPVRDFEDAATLFAQALQALSRGRRRRAGGTARRAALAVLDRLAAPASPIIVEADDSLRQEWVAPTLLSAFALMALLDITEQRRPMSCANCGQLFTTRARQGTYCSDSCRWAAQKRRHRARKMGARD